MYIIPIDWLIGNITNGRRVEALSTQTVCPLFTSLRNFTHRSGQPKEFIIVFLSRLGSSC